MPAQFLSVPGPASNPALRTLFSEYPREIDRLSDEVFSTLTGNDIQARRNLRVLVDAAQSATRLNARLAFDSRSATQLERSVLRVLAKIRKEFLDGKAPLATREAQLTENVTIIKSLIAQLPLTRLQASWPMANEDPRLLNSVYRAGNMLTALQFLLEENPTEELTVLMAHCDYVHLKLLEILRRSNRELRVMCESDRFELLRRFESLVEVASLAPNLHCRVSASGETTVISSADLNVDCYTTHIEAGVMLNVRKTSLKLFLDSMWSHGVPMAAYYRGLTNEAFVTSHILLSFVAPDAPADSYPFEVLVREVSAEVHRALTYHGKTGYVESEKTLGLIFVNLKASEQRDEVNSEITNVFNLQFGESCSIIPVPTVIDASGRESYVSGLADAYSPLTVFYIAGGLPDNVRGVARRIENLYGMDHPDLHSVGYSLASHSVVRVFSEEAAMTPPNFVALIHYGELIGASDVFTVQDAVKQSLWRLFRRRPHDRQIQNE
jgi:hypothetical protein